MKKECLIAMFIMICSLTSLFIYSITLVSADLTSEFLPYLQRLKVKVYDQSGNYLYTRDFNPSNNWAIKVHESILSNQAWYNKGLIKNSSGNYIRRYPQNWEDYVGVNKITYKWIMCIMESGDGSGNNKMDAVLSLQKIIDNENPSKYAVIIDYCQFTGTSWYYMKLIDTGDNDKVLISKSCTGQIQHYYLYDTLYPEDVFKQTTCQCGDPYDVSEAELQQALSQFKIWTVCIPHDNSLIPESYRDFKYWEHWWAKKLNYVTFYWDYWYKPYGQGLYNHRVDIGYLMVGYEDYNYNPPGSNNNYCDLIITICKVKDVNNPSKYAIYIASLIGSGSKKQVVKDGNNNIVYVYPDKDTYPDYCLRWYTVVDYLN